MSLIVNERTTTDPTLPSAHAPKWYGSLSRGRIGTMRPISEIIRRACEHKQIDPDAALDRLLMILLSCHAHSYLALMSQPTPAASDPLHKRSPQTVLELVDETVAWEHRGKADILRSIPETERDQGWAKELAREAQCNEALRLMLKEVKNEAEYRALDLMVGPDQAEDDDAEAEPS